MTAFPPVPGAVANLRGLKLQASTGPAGFALQNATPPIISWAVPADGNPHRVFVICSASVTSALTGGAVRVNTHNPDGSLAASTLFNGGEGVSGFGSAPVCVPVQAGSTVSVAQFTAATAGAATVWIEIWGL